MRSAPALDLRYALPPHLSDVSIGEGPVPPTLDGATSVGVLWQAKRGAFLLDVPDVARYLVLDGRSITIDAAAGVSEAQVSLFLRMTPVAALLFQRGVLALHASAAVAPRGGVLLAGDSSSGKSTLLAELVRRGWPMLADDMVGVTLESSGRPMVHPMHGEVLLWPDALERLDGSGRRPLLRGRAVGISSAAGRRALGMWDRLGAGPVHVGEIWLLGTHNAAEIDIAEVRGANRFGALANMRYNSQIASALLDPTAYLRSAGAIAEGISFHRLRRPRGRWCTEAIADIVQAGTV